MCFRSSLAFLLWGFTWSFTWYFKCVWMHVQNKEYHHNMNFSYNNVFFNEPSVLTEPCDEWLQAAHYFSLWAGCSRIIEPCVICCHLKHHSSDLVYLYPASVKWTHLKVLKATSEVKNAQCLQVTSGWCAVFPPYSLTLAVYINSSLASERSLCSLYRPRWASGKEKVWENMARAGRILLRPPTRREGEALAWPSKDLMGSSILIGRMSQR